MKEFKELEKSIKKIESGKKKLRKTVYELLSRTDKVFCITVDGVTFDFKPTFTIEEEYEMIDLRFDCINALFHKATTTNSWEPILALAMGTDPSQLQFEKYEVEESYEIDESNKFETHNTKSDGSNPDGVDNWYLRMQKTPGAGWHNPVTGGKFENIDEVHKGCEPFISEHECTKEHKYEVLECCMPFIGGHICERSEDDKQY